MSISEAFVAGFFAGLGWLSARGSWNCFWGAFVWVLECFKALIDATGEQ